MEIKQLQYFIAVAEHLNFSRAAEKLYVSQPALSYQIAELEKELGTSLFIRDRRKVFLTPAGGALLPLARTVLDAAQDIFTAAQNGFPEQEAIAPLSIALDQTEDHFESTGVTQLIAEFEVSHPDIPMKMRQMDYDQCIQGLLNETLDVACLVLRHNETLPSLLACKPVHRDRLKLLCKYHPDIHGIEDAFRLYGLLLAGDRPRGQSRVTKCLDNLGITPTIIAVDSIPVSFIQMQAGKGVIPLPGNYIRQHQYSGTMCLEIPDPGAALTHVLAWNKFSRNSSIQLLVNSFDDIILED